MERWYFVRQNIHRNRPARKGGRGRFDRKRPEKKTRKTRKAFGSHKGLESRHGLSAYGLGLGLHAPWSCHRMYQGSGTSLKVGARRPRHMAKDSEFTQRDKSKKGTPRQKYILSWSRSRPKKKTKKKQALELWGWYKEPAAENFRRN